MGKMKCFTADQIITMIIFKILTITVFSILGVHADVVNRVEVRTANCDDCGMSNTFGALRLQICNAFKECCFTDKLDVRFHDDFDEGAIDIFEGHDILSTCDYFDMRNSAPQSIMMSLNHEGTDGYQSDYIKAWTDSGYYECYFSKFLDGDDSEQGQDCISL